MKGTNKGGDECCSTIVTAKNADDDDCEHPLTLQNLPLTHLVLTTGAAYVWFPFIGITDKSTTYVLSS